MLCAIFITGNSYYFLAGNVRNYENFSGLFSDGLSVFSKLFGMISKMFRMTDSQNYYEFLIKIGSAVDNLFFCFQYLYNMLLNEMHAAILATIAIQDWITLLPHPDIAAYCL